MLRRFCDKVKLSSDYFSFSGLEKNARDHKRAAKIQTGLNSSQDLATTSRGVLNSRNFRYDHCHNITCSAALGVD